MSFISCKKHIPNSITCCNLICGCIAAMHAVSGSLSLALLFIILGAVFDFFDGMVARLLGVSSPIGKELDSLSDHTSPLPGRLRHRKIRIDGIQDQQQQGPVLRFVGTVGGRMVGQRM